MRIINAGNDSTGYYYFVLSKKGNVYRVDNAHCIAEAEDSVCLAEYGEEWCIKYLGMIKPLYYSKNPDIDLEKVYKKYRSIVKKAIA